MSSFVGETLQKAVDAAKNVFGKPPTILLVLLPDTGEHAALMWYQKGNPTKRG